MAEEPQFIFDPSVGKFVPPLSRPSLSLVPRRPASLAVVGMLFAILVAVLVFLKLDFTFDTKTRLSGANIDHAILMVVCGGLAGLLIIPFVRRRRGLLVALLLLQAATLGAAIALVGLDGATYKARFVCAFMCFSDSPPYTSTHHLWYLYLLWGVPLVVLLVQVYRVLRKRPYLQSA